MRKRQTIQRKLVLDALKELTNHPTALEIHNKIRERYDGISVATVYSNLKSLAEDGTVRVVTYLGTADRFDLNTGEHYHIKCELCGDFCDLTMELPITIDETVAEGSGYIVKRHDMIFQGICPQCQKAAALQV